MGHEVLGGQGQGDTSALVSLPLTQGTPPVGAPPLTPLRTRCPPAASRALHARNPRVEDPVARVRGRV